MTREHLANLYFSLCDWDRHSRRGTSRTPAFAPAPSLFRPPAPSALFKHRCWLAESTPGERVAIGCSRGGFTLLEVMVSLAILSMSLVAILNLHSGTVRVHNHSKHLTVATLLARSKMIDVEEYLLDEGLPEFDEQTEGNFEEDGYPGYWWRVEVVKPDLGMDASTIQGLLGQAMGFLGGGEENGASMLGGVEEMTGSGVGGLIQGQLQALLDTLQEGVREVRLTIGWTDVTGPSDFSVVTHVVRLEGQGAPGGTEERAREELQRSVQDQERRGVLDHILPRDRDARPHMDIDRRGTLPGGGVR